MKNLLSKSLMFMGTMFAVVAGLASCGSDSDNNPTPTLNVSNPSLSMDGTGGSASFQVTSNTKWVASSGASWCVVSPQSGEGHASVDVTASENTAISSRTCTIRVRTTDGSLSQDVTVVQSGASVSLSTNGTTELTFTSEKGNAKELDIKCNTEWQISGVPDWLDLPKRNGDGNATVTFTTLSANNTASQRSATLRVTAGTEAVSVLVTQAAGLASCTVYATNVVVLGDAIACDWKYSSDVKYYYIGLWLESGVDRLDDSEIISKLTSNVSDRDVPTDNYVTSWDGLSSNTTYVLFTISYDNDGNHGELIKQKITTRKVLNLEAAADIDNIYRSSDNKMKWSITPSGKCASYHMISGVDVSTAAISCSPVIYAWLINNYLVNSKYGLFTNYTIDTNIIREGSYQKNINTPLYSPTNVFIATWGKFSDLDGGDYSSGISYAQGYLNAMTSSSNSNISIRKTEKKEVEVKRTNTDLRIFSNCIIK
ncbi:MAG: BACON domain-containing protein [Bacteroides sp.]|nr:BACON domain-containing protein [Roseburia sp.]MCM1346632.1 BACON domain-containing protein [Bacteroides sp.]MCM1420041.1 BACON domain-containing protein [Bacteroides sp.]